MGSLLIHDNRNRRRYMGGFQNGLRGVPLLVAGFFAVAGFGLMQLAGAATYATTAEAESGVLAGNAGDGDPSGAAGNAAVKFGLAVTPPTTPPATPPSGGGSCALPKYPTPSCTGVPAGTNLTTVNGDYNAKTANEVIDGKHFTGSVNVTASGVTIKNSQIDGVILADVASGTPVMITDTTIGKASGCVVSPGIDTTNDKGNYTAVRVRIQGHDDGFRAGGPNITIRDSYVKNCGQSNSHGDGIQDYPAVQNLVFEHNTMDLCGPWTAVPASKADCNVPGHNSPIFIHSDPGGEFGGSKNVSIRNNLVLGGVFSLYLYPTSNGPWNVTGNRVVNNTWDFGSYETEGQCGKVTSWSDNTIVSINAGYEVTGTVRTVACGGN